MFSVTDSVNMSIADTHHMVIKATHDSNFFGSMCAPFRDHLKLYIFHADELDSAYGLRVLLSA